MHPTLPLPDTVTLNKINDLLDESRAEQAWGIVKELAPMETWPAGPARRTAGALASHLGDERLGAALDYLNFRETPELHKSFFYYQFARLRYTNLSKVINSIKLRRDSGKYANAVEHAELIGLEAFLYSSVMDFEVATTLINKALELAPDDYWTHIQHSHILVRQDKYEEAYSAVLVAQKLNRWARPVIIQLVACLIHLGRDSEAEAICKEALDTVRNGSFAARLQALYSDKNDYVLAKHYLDVYKELSPLLPGSSKEWFNTRYSDFSYTAGELEESIKLLEDVGSEFYKNVRKNMLKASSSSKRKMLDVSFIRQHRMTCAPATLASLAKFWGRDADHLEIANKICYEGTPWHKERAWARSQGFAVREFTLEREILIQLIDRDIPFTLTTASVNSSHLQACIGYDDIRGVVLLRDPTERHYGEMLLEGLIESHADQGPRCMVIIPEELESKLDGLSFPNQSLLDQNHILDVALEEKKTITAEGAVKAMQIIDKEHALTLMAQISLAHYQQNMGLALDLWKKAVERFKGNQRIQYRYFFSLRAFVPRKEVVEYIAEIVENSESSNVLRVEYAELLLDDMRDVDKAIYHFECLLKNSKTDSRVFSGLSVLQLRNNQWEDALVSSRFASCLAPSDEFLANRYFNICLKNGKLDEGLEFLKKRKVQESRNSAKVGTYIEALAMVGKVTEARAELDLSLEKFPEDQEMLMLASNCLYKWGESEWAEKLLHSARGKVDEAWWFYQAHQIAIHQGNRSLAMHHLQSLLTRKPESIDAISAYSRLLSEKESVSATIDYLKSLSEKYQTNTDIIGLYADWLGEESPLVKIEALRKVYSIDPHNLWAVRELALSLADEGELAEAFSLVEEALEKQPLSVESIGILASFQKKKGDSVAALESVKKALRVNVDTVYALNLGYEYSVESGGISDYLSFVKEQLNVQVSNGDGLLVYRSLANAHLRPEDLLNYCDGVWRKRKDLIDAWQLKLYQLRDLGETSEALGFAREMVEAYPVVPQSWADLAMAYRESGDLENEVKAFQKALSIKPSWSMVARKLATTYEMLGEFAKSERVLRDAIKWEPLQPSNYGLLADLLCRQDKLAEAFEILKTGLHNNSNYTWGWGMLANLAVELDRRAEVTEVLEHHRAIRGKSWRWWMIEYSVLFDIEGEEAAYEALDKAYEIEPNEPEIVDIQAFCSFKKGEHEQAFKWIENYPSDDRLPRALRLREAWLYMELHNSDKAIELATKLVNDEPDYEEGYSRLVSWLSEREDWSGILRYAKKWANISSDNVVPLGYVGRAEESLNNAKGAFAAYQKACWIDPEYNFGYYRLFDLGAQVGELDFLERMLPKVHHFSTEQIAWRCDFQLATYKKDKERQNEAWGKLIRCKEVDQNDLSELPELAKGMQKPANFHKRLVTVVESGEASSSETLVAWIWNRRYPEKIAKKLQALPYEDEMKIEAWTFLITSMIENEQPDCLRKIIYKYPIIKSSDILWGKAGYGLMMISTSAYTQQWLVDYKSRKDAQQWMLLNLVLASITEGNFDYASQVCSYALSELKFDHTASNLSSYLAFAHAVEGNVDQAEEILSRMYSDSSDNTLWNAAAQLAKMKIETVRENKKQASIEWANLTVRIPDYKKAENTMALVKRMKKSFKQNKLTWAGEKTFMEKLFWK